MVFLPLSQTLPLFPALAGQEALLTNKDVFLPTLAAACGYLLLFCLAAFLLVKFFGVKAGAARGKARQNGFFQVLDRYYLSPQRSLLLVKLGNKVFLIGSSEKGMDMLGEVPKEEVPPELMELADKASQPASVKWQDFFYTFRAMRWPENKS